MKRRVDEHRLNEWMAKKGPSGLTVLVEETRLSIHTLYRMSAGIYKNEPSPATRKAMCDATGMSEDELFPLQRDQAS